MSVPIPQRVLYSLACLKLCCQELVEKYVGKVRHTYELPGFPHLLLVVVSNRISVYDFVLNLLVKFKGEVLTAKTIFFLTVVLKDVKHHLVAYGSGIDEYLPEALRNDSDLQARSVVIKRLKMLPVEAIVRGYITGSYWKVYDKANGQIEGVNIKGFDFLPGLKDGDELEEVLFTPSTKDEAGDVNISFKEMVKVISDWLDAEGINRDHVRLAMQIRDLSLEYYRRILEYAKERGIILADTKFEFGLDEQDQLVLADETFTPDSSRFWGVADHKCALEEGRTPASRDKEFVRGHAKKVKTPFFTIDPDGVEAGRRKEDIPDFDLAVNKPIVGLNHKAFHPDDPDHTDFVAKYEFEPTVGEETSSIYLGIFKDLVGKPLQQFQQEDMGIVA